MTMRRHYRSRHACVAAVVVSASFWAPSLNALRHVAATTAREWLKATSFALLVRSIAAARCLESSTTGEAPAISGRARVSFRVMRHIGRYRQFIFYRQPSA